MARIALAPDVARLVGDFAESVENRSLLLDKLIFHKSWPVEQDERGKTIKWDDASRWSFMRLADDGSTVLKAEAVKLRRFADGRNVEPQNRDRMLAQAKIADQLSLIKPPSPEVVELRARHTRRFLTLFQNAQQNRGTVIIGKLEGRLAINLADGLVQNANICLDRLLGVPYIPGSAVKGVTRHTALEELKAASGADRSRLLDAFIRIFGVCDNDFGKDGSLRAFKSETLTHERKGAIAFLPAWPVNNAKIVVDLTNVHTPDYYRSGHTADLANEAPRLNPFPVVETGAQFAFAIVLNGMADDPALLQQAGQWLRTALTVRGLGAKTAAGYGWFSIDEAAVKTLADAALADEAKAKQEAQARAAAEAKRLAEQAQAQAEADRLASLGPVDREMEALLSLPDEKFASFAKNLGTATEDQQHALIRLLREHKAKRDRWKAWKKNDKKDIVGPIQETVAKLSLPPLP